MFKRIIVLLFILFGGNNMVIASTYDKDDVGSWVIDSSIDPLTDIKSQYIGLVASEGKGVYGKDIYMVIYCESNKTYFGISTEMIAQNKPITYRIDKHKPVTEKWPSTIKSTQKENPISLIKGLINSDKFIIRIPTVNGSDTTAIFYLRGMSNAIKDVRKACHW